MDFIQIILLELLLLFSAIGGIFAYKRKLPKQIALTLAVPVSFVLAVLLDKTCVPDISGSILGMIAGMGGGDIADMLTDSAATTSLVAYLIRIFIDHFLTVVLFLLLLLITRIVIAIVFGIIGGKEEKPVAKETPAPAAEVSETTESAEPEKTPEPKKASEKGKYAWIYDAGVVALGVAKGYMIFMFLLLPIVFILNFTTPAVDELAHYAEDEDLKEVYVFAEDTIGYLDNTVVMQTAKYTGFRFFNTWASDVICSDELAGNDGKVYEIKDSSFLPGITRLGVNGLVAYQEYASTGAISPKLLGAVSGILENLSDMPIIHAVAAEFLATVDPGEPNEEEAIMRDMILLLQDTYSVENSTNLGDDLGELAGLTGYLQGVIEEPLYADDMTDAFMQILSDETKTKEIVRYLAATHAFNGGFPYFMGFGIDILGNELNLMPNKAEHYAKVTLALADLLNSTAANIGEIDFVAVEKYIVYAAAEGIDPDGYTVADPNNMTELDVQFSYYQRYMKQMDALRALLYGEAVQKSANPFTVSFIAEDGTVYYYSKNGSTAVWTTVAPGETVAGNLVLHLLLSETVKSDVSVTVDMVTAWASTYTSAQLSSLYPSASAMMDAEAAFAAKFVSADNFASVTVYTDDILAAFEASYDGSFDDDGVTQFAKILTSVAGLMNVIGEAEDGDVVDVVINNFGKVGILLDAINNFAPTADMPESLLTAIRYSPDYGQYFNINAIDELVANIENGESTYESLFSLIQSIYGLFQEIQ